MRCECGLTLSRGDQEPTRSPTPGRLGPPAAPRFELKALAGLSRLNESITLAIDSVTSATSSVTPVIDSFARPNEVTRFQSSSPFTRVIDSLALVFESRTLVSQLTCSDSLTAVLKGTSLPTRIESITVPADRAEGAAGHPKLHAPGKEEPPGRPEKSKCAEQEKQF